MCNIGGGAAGGGEGGPAGCNDKNKNPIIKYGKLFKKKIF